MDRSSSAQMHKRPRNRLVTALLACGVVVAAVQIAGDVVAATLDPGYSYANQTVSELSAIGAPPLLHVHRWSESSGSARIPLVGRDRWGKLTCGVRGRLGYEEGLWA